MNPGDGFLGSLVDEKRIFPDLAGATASEVLTEMADGLARVGAVSDGEDAARRLIERERMGSTGLGGGLAIPHCKLKELSEVVLAIGVSRRGVDFLSSDGVPVTLVFLVLSPADAPALHLQALARISRVIRMPGIAETLRQKGTPAEIAAVLRETDDRLAVPV